MTSVSTATPGLEAASPHVTPERRRRGVLLIRGATILLGLVILFQLLAALGYISFGFANWQPVLFAYVLWSVALCWGLVLRDGEAGWRAVFVLPAVLFTVALVMIFMPCFSKALRARAEISSSSTGKMRSITSTTVTSTPRLR